MEQYFVYILFSEKLNKYYIGSTGNLTERVELHNSGKSKFTSSGIPWSLFYSEIFLSRNEAMKREYEIKKKKSRIYIESLISGKEGCPGFSRKLSGQRDHRNQAPKGLFLFNE